MDDHDEYVVGFGSSDSELLPDGCKNHNTPKMGNQCFGTHAAAPPVGPWVPALGLRAAQATHFWWHIAPGAMGMLWQHASCPKTAKNRQNPSCHRQTPKCWPKSVGMSKRHGTVQPGAWPSAHTCQQQPQACVCPLRPLGANTSGKTRLTPMGPMAPLAAV